MKRTVWLWQLMGFAVTALVGTILHFLYEWLGEAAWIAPYSGVNESTWEHMKLLFWPMLFYAIFQGFFFKERKDFPCIILRGMLIGLLLIPILFYTYNGVVGRSPDWINIAIFFISAAVVYVYEAFELRRESTTCNNPTLASLMIAVIAVLFVLFTFVTPELSIFKDPISGSYGIQNS